MDLTLTAPFVYTAKGLVRFSEQGDFVPVPIRHLYMNKKPIEPDKRTSSPRPAKAAKKKAFILS